MFDAVACAIEVQNYLFERIAAMPEDRRIDFRVGVDLGDVVEESDGDLMGDGAVFLASQGAARSRRSRRHRPRPDLARNMMPLQDWVRSDGYLANVGQ